MNKNVLLNTILASINSEKNMYLFLEALFTSKELKELENRIKIFQLLMQGKKHREISEILNVGIATVTRGANAYEKEEIFEKKIPILQKLRLNKNKKNE
jgi:Trp operon repressor